MTTDALPLFRHAVKRIVADPTMPDITVRQLAVMLHIAGIPKGQPGPSTAAVAAELNVHKPAVTRAMQRLKDEGLVVSVRSPMDERKIEISATAAGLGFVAKVAKAMSAA